MKAFFKHFRISILLNALVSLALGLLILLFPENRFPQTNTIKMLAIVVSAAVLVLAVYLIIRALAKQRGKESFDNAIALGISLIALGIGMLLKLDVVVEIVGWILLLLALYHGILDLFYAVREQKIGISVWYLSLIFGILLIAGAALCLPDPETVIWGKAISYIHGGVMLFDATCMLYNGIVMAIGEKRAEAAKEIIEVEPETVDDSPAEEAE